MSYCYTYKLEYLMLSCNFLKCQDVSLMGQKCNIWSQISSYSPPPDRHDILTSPAVQVQHYRLTLFLSTTICGRSKCLGLSILFDWNKVVKGEYAQRKEGLCIPRPTQDSEVGKKWGDIYERIWEWQLPTPQQWQLKQKGNMKKLPLQCFSNFAAH